jgi:glycosyltransferase involved in cell wall biosynthesis
VIIPALNEEDNIAGVVERTREFAPAVVVVDDGSSDRTAERAEQAGAAVIRHPRNIGKGAALNSGFQYAQEHGFDVVVTMDADGQHDPAEIPRFIEAYVRTGIPVLVGNRMGDPRGMPPVRRMTNWFLSWLLSRRMKVYVPDTQCGFRLYRCDVIPFVSTESERYAAESEILLYVAARGIRVDSVPIASIYNGAASKINPVKDTFRFFAMLRRCKARERGSDRL